MRYNCLSFERANQQGVLKTQLIDCLLDKKLDGTSTSKR